MSAEVKLHEILSANAPVVAIVGDKIFHKYVKPEADLPAIAYIRNSTSYNATIHGFDIEDTATIDIYCAGTSDEEAENLGNLVDAIFVPPPRNMTKVNRSTMYDEEKQIHAVIITVNVDP